MPLTQKAIKSITQEVSKQLPDLKNINPTITEYAPSSNYLLTYKTVVNLPGGNTMTKVAKVVANSKGKIIKISLSK